MPSALAFVNKAVTKGICSMASPPETVIPPRLPQNDLNLIASDRTSSTVRSFDLSFVIAQVSGLWQNLQRILQPCIKMTNRTPGPSTLPKLSVELDRGAWRAP